ncbi:MAG: hypothetical protein V8K32_00415 [Candidatus Electrothrix gigas]
MNEKEGEILLPNTGLKLRQKRRDKGKRHNLDDNTDFSNRSNLKRRDSCVQNFSLRYFHIEKKLRSESLDDTRMGSNKNLSTKNKIQSFFSDYFCLFNICCSPEKEYLSSDVIDRNSLCTPLFSLADQRRGRLKRL